MTRSPLQPITVGILADLPPGLGGGVNQFTRGFVQSLVSTRLSDFRFVVFVSAGDTSWNLPRSEHLAVVEVEPFELYRGWKRWADRIDRYARAAVAAATNDRLGARVSARFGERTRRILRAVARSPWPLDVMHFPFQSAAPMSVPTIFGLWDLQHLHLPELRPARVGRQLDAYYRWCCRLADRVAFGSDWARRDALSRYGLHEDRTAVVPAASPLRLVPPPSADQLADVRRRFSLPHRFAFYPAVAWPHKNHKNLISALARLRGTSSELHVVCAGHAARLLPGLIDHAERLGVRHRVHFTGYVSDGDVKAMYRLAEFCVYPSLFEGAGLPLLEAFDEGCPVAASGVASIPEYAGGAALLFDPHDIDAIAAAMTSLASDAQLRSSLRERGTDRAREFSWDRVVAGYRSLYLELARQTTSTRTRAATSVLEPAAHSRS